MGTISKQVFAVALLSCGAIFGAEKPRVFITESGTAQLSGKASMGDTEGALAFNGGTSSYNIQVMKAFSERCPGVTVTSDRDKALYVVRLDHEELNPTSVFVPGNKVAVFNRNEDLVYSGTARTLKNAVKGACGAITASSK